MTNKNYSFLARGVEYTGERHLEKTEEIEIHLVSFEELKEIVSTGGIKQRPDAGSIMEIYCRKQIN